MKINLWFQIAFGLQFVNFSIKKNIRDLNQNCRKELQKTTLVYFYQSLIKKKMTYSSKNILIPLLNLYSILSFMPFQNQGQNSTIN